MVLLRLSVFNSFFVSSLTTEILLSMVYVINLVLRLLFKGSGADFHEGQKDLDFWHKHYNKPLRKCSNGCN